MSTTTVTGAAMIDDVPVLRWGKSGECTFAGALSAATAVTDHPLRYSDIMGDTALAFRLRWYRGNGNKPQELWCPSSPVGEFGEEIDLARRQLGWSLRVHVAWDKPEPRFADLRDQIVASIDAGQPIVGYGKDMNVGVIIGYDDAGRTLLSRDYMLDDPTQPYRFPFDKLGPWIMFLGEHRDPAAPRDRLKLALQTAVAHWDYRNPHHAAENGTYLYGKPAYDQWIDDLTNASTFSEPLQRQLFFVSWWCFDSLVDARMAAATYLKAQAGATDDAAVTAALQSAADACEALTRELGPTFRKQDAFLGPWTEGRKFEDWSADMRQREIDLLTAARNADADMNKHLIEALQLISVK